MNKASIIIKRQTAELHYLIEDVERKMGFRLSGPSDFNVLMLRIEQETGRSLAMSTVKRLWGYVDNTHTPSSTTLDILSAFVGYSSWTSYCETLSEEHKIESDIFNRSQVYSKELTVGDHIFIAWMPDRECRLQYLGDDIFKVVDAVNAKIQCGDTFRAMSFSCGKPLYATDLHRGDTIIGDYVAGKAAGLTHVEVESITASCKETK